MSAFKADIRSILNRCAEQVLFQKMENITQKINSYHNSKKSKRHFIHKRWFFRVILKGEWLVFYFLPTTKHKYVVL